MFRILRNCYTCLKAGLIGMLAGIAGQIYIFEFSDRSDVLMQAASVFKELDELSFLITIASALVFLYFCVLLEYRCWNRSKKHREKYQG